MRDQLNYVANIFNDKLKLSFKTAFCLISKKDCS